MKRLVPYCIAVLASLWAGPVVAQQTLQPSRAVLHQPWKASWIALPGESGLDYGVYLFRRTFHLDSPVVSFPVHVSADNRYKLYVNGRLVSLGPARGDLYHWNYETVDLAPYLQQGENTLAARVWNQAGYRPEAQISLRTGFILQGGNAAAAAINTNGMWKCRRDSSYAPLRFSGPFYYVSGPGELIDHRLQPQGWQQNGYADSSWKPAQALFAGMPKEIHGGYGTSNGWMLQPSSLPAMELREQRLAAVREATGITPPAGFPATRQRVVVPPHTTVTLLLDQGQLTNAYPQVEFSQGKGATLSIGYTEALYTKFPDKGNRNEVTGKLFLGRKDSIHSNGSAGQQFTTLEWRTFRYIRLLIKTAADPLVLDDIRSTFTGYPFSLEAEFHSGLPELKRMLDIGWHTARLCAVETYMDCPYYEQLQYIGDARIQALVSLYNSGDDRLLRNALDLADASRLPEGLTLSRHPSYTPQIIPTFSLWYIGMLHDYWRYGKDTFFVKDKLPGTRQVLEYFSRYQQSDGSLKAVPNWMFTDWVNQKDWHSGVAPVGKEGSSSVVDMTLLWAYRLAAAMEGRMGMDAYRQRYEKAAEQLERTIRNKYYDGSRGLYADRPEKDRFSQHANSLAILSGVATGREHAALAEKLLGDTSLAPASIYFRYYLHQALIRAGRGNEYLDWLDKWRENIQSGLTTWAEMSEVSSSRSDCHAWGSSPNIEFFRTMLGIDSDAPGFRKIRVTPHPGPLKELAGSIPHPAGSLTVKITGAGNSRSFHLHLPPGISGTLVWKGRNYPLKPGSNHYTLPQ